MRKLNHYSFSRLGIRANSSALGSTKTSRKRLSGFRGGNEEHYHSGVSLDKEVQRKSLQWIREQSMAPNCMESLDTHDNDIKPHVIEL